MIETSPTLTKLAGAMHAVQKAVGSVPKDSTNPHYKNRYASLESVNDAIREHYLAAGLAVMQAPGQISDGGMTLTTLIVHAESGEWLKNTMQIPLGKVDPQGAGSALTYAERYSLMALFNLSPVDDDAETVVRQPPRAVTPAPAAPAPGPISQAAVSSQTRQRLMEALNKGATRSAVRKWVERPDVQVSIDSLTDKDRTFFDAEYQKKWASLPETAQMAG